MISRLQLVTNPAETGIAREERVEDHHRLMDGICAAGGSAT
jgi:hypothetical protein